MMLGLARVVQGKSKIAETQLVIYCEERVLRLDIPVQDAL